MNRDSIETVLHGLMSELTTPSTLGFMLAGSYAKGTATAQSDIDLTHFVSNDQAGGQTFLLYEGFVIDVLVSHLPDQNGVFARPEVAIFAVPAWRMAQILLDQTGTLTATQAQAKAFQWSSIQEEANAKASFALYRKAPEVLSLIHAVEQNDFYHVHTTSGYILLWLAQAVALRHGVLINNEKSLFGQVKSSVGDDHEWSRALDRASGIDLTPEVPIAVARGQATLRLYEITTQLFEDIILPDHHPLIQHTLDQISAARIVN